MLSQFFNLDAACPCCGNKMSMYMHWTKYQIFNGAVDSHNQLIFTPIHSADNFEFKNEAVFLSLNDDTLEFSSKALENEAKKHHIYFLRICQPKGLLSLESPKGRFKVSPVKSCSYQSTPFYEFQENESTKKWDFVKMKSSDVKPINHVMKDEAFAFTTVKDGLTKVYVLGLDYVSDNTKLYFYTVTEEQKKIPGFKPNIFEKELPLLPHKPDLSLDNRENLLSKFDSWIIMS